MATIQEVKYKKDKKMFSRYFLPLDKKVVEQLALDKGDKLYFNGQMGDELRFRLKRKAEVEAEILRRKQLELDQLKQK